MCVCNDDYNVTPARQAASPLPQWKIPLESLNTHTFPHKASQNTDWVISNHREPNPDVQNHHTHQHNDQPAHPEPTDPEGFLVRTVCICVSKFSIVASF